MFARCRKQHEEPPPPKAPVPRSQFDDPPFPTVELQTLAHLAANVVTAATPDRYRMLDLALREELAEPGVELEAMAPYSKRRLLAMMSIIWKHREPYMIMRDSEMAEMSGHLAELEGDEYTRAKCKKLSMAQRTELDTRSEGYG